MSPAFPAHGVALMQNPLSAPVRRSPLPAMLLLLTLLAPAAAAGPGAPDGPPGEGPPADESTTTRGRILLPTATTFRPFVPNAGQGVTHWTLIEVRAGAPFRLEPDAAPSQAGSCPSGLTCLVLPNFDVVFYGGAADNGMSAAVATYNEPGAESGKVPANARSAIVFLRYGPGALASEGTPFVLTQGAPAPSAAA